MRLNYYFVNTEMEDKPSRALLSCHRWIVERGEERWEWVSRGPIIARIIAWQTPRQVFSMILTHINHRHHQLSHHLRGYKHTFSILTDCQEIIRYLRLATKGFFQLCLVKLSFERKFFPRKLHHLYLPAFNFNLNVETLNNINPIKLASLQQFKTKVDFNS